jgi:hypothetical protein
MSVTDTRTEGYDSAAIRNGRQTHRSDAVTVRQSEANTTAPKAVTCQKCRATIPPDKPVVIVDRRGLSSGLRNGHPVCIDCATASAYRLLIPWARTHRPRTDYEHYCLRCRRVFYGSVHRRYCSDECGELERRMRRTPNQPKPEPRPCVGCGEGFVPSRSDAVYCSNACRQRAYRQRKG